MLRSTPHLSQIYRVIFFMIVLLSLFSSKCFAGGKLGIYGIRMVPDGKDAENYSSAGYGLGLHVVYPFEEVSNIFALTGGLEFINLLSETVEYRDPDTWLRVEQQTSQDYFRLFIGGQIGGHGKGFIRPHAGLNLAMIIYGISTDVVVPDDYDRENEIRQNLSSKTRVICGTDITLGVDLNFYNEWNIDVGVRYLKSFSLPQQLGEGSEKIHPQYFQFYIGVGVSFRTITGAYGQDE